MSTLNKFILNKLAGYIFGSGELNDPLKKNWNLQTYQKVQSELMDKVFADAPPLKRDIVVYKGADVSKPNSLRPLQLHQKNMAYVSTSLSKDVAKSFMFGSKCCILNITIPKGSKILPLYMISAQKTDEFEILLPRFGYLNFDSLEADLNGATYATYQPLESKEYYQEWEEWGADNQVYMVSKISKKAQMIELARQFNFKMNPDLTTKEMWKILKQRPWLDQYNRFL